MAGDLPVLYELEIKFLPSDDDGVLVTTALHEHGTYPPAAQLEADRIVFPSLRKTHRGNEVHLPAEMIMSPVWPSFDPDTGRLLSDRSEYQFEKIADRLDELAKAIFQPPTDDLLRQLLSLSEPFVPFGPPPNALSRITFVFEPDEDSPRLHWVPWEWMRAPHNSEPLSERCVMLRRLSKKAGEGTGSFDLPLNVAFGSETTEIPPENIQAWGAGLFDKYTNYARHYGGIQWDQLDYSDIKPGEAQHLVYDSSDRSSAYGIANRLGRTSEPGGLHDSMPRLLVLHDISAALPRYLMAEWVHSMLWRGTDAVLLVGLPTSDPRAGDFFPTFYRKLMHNWPLDQCVWAAQSAAISKGQSVDFIFAAREEGEFGLLLSRAPLEATQRVSVSERAWPTHPKEISHVELQNYLRTDPLFARIGDRAPAADEAQDRATLSRRTRGQRRKRGRPVGGRIEEGGYLPEERSLRVAADLENALLAAARNQRNAAFNKVATNLEGLQFDQELSGINHVLHVRSMARDVMSEAALQIHEAEAAAESIGVAAPASVQAAMLRLTNLWITERELESEPRIISPHHYLVAGKPYHLHLQIGPRRMEAVIAERFNEESLKKVFEKVDEVILDVMFFSTDKDFGLAGDELDPPDKVSSEGHTVLREQIDGEERELRSERGRWGRHATVRLPRFGPSSELQIQVTPVEAGQRRIRTCIYYRNVLLQSVVLDAEVANEGSQEAALTYRSPEKTITGRTTDYLATIDFALLNELPHPSLNVFSNYDEDGTHWVGAYSSGNTEAFQLKSGDMRVFDKDLLNTRAERMREIFTKIEGEKHAYKLDAQLPLNDDDIERREGYFRDLALSGWRLFHPLFMVNADDTGGDNAQRLENFRDTAQNSHIISIARCGPNSSTLPWAALYSNYLDRNKESEIKLCGVFKQQLAENKWKKNSLIEKHDLLDDPKQCRNLATCPLSTDQADLTICPFGFWGFLHQVEQPLQQVKPTPVDEEPEALRNYNFGQTSFLSRPANQPVKVAVGTYPGIPDVIDHKAELQALPLTMQYEDDRDQVMLLLAGGGQHLYYFYCHGDVDEKEKIFRLKLGPSAKPGYIESSDLLPKKIKWSEQKPLVIMNGCETMAVTPDVTHGFLNTLKALGASGVVGTEIKVWTKLARPFGVDLLKHLLEGLSVGEAFLEVRKHLLRQYNPLGLIYSYYAPATLHLHDPERCDWCSTHGA